MPSLPSPADHVLAARAATEAGELLVHLRAELMAGRIPADMPAFEHGYAGAEARGLQRYREAGKSGPHHANVNIQVERQARTKRRVVGAVGRTCESLGHGVSYGPLQRLSPCPGHEPVD